MTTRHVQHADVVDYLRLNGWQSRGRGGKRPVALFEHQGTDRSRGEPVTVEVVTDPTLGDYARRMHELVKLLAAFEGASAQEMTDAIAAPSSDVLSLAMRSDAVATGSIPLEDSVRLRLAQKSLLLAAAHSVLEPRGHFPRMARAEAIEFLSRVREGQTAHGSYVTRLLVSLPRPVQLGFDPPSPPYARTVTEKLLGALDAVATAIETGTPESLLSKPQLGVSANLLQGLSDLRPPGSMGTLDVSVRWAGGWAVPKAVPTHIRFSAGEFEILPSLAKQLRDREESIQHTVEGYIVRLARDQPDAGSPGDVIVVAPREDAPGREMKIRISLPGGEYEKAVQAHKEANKIQVIGTLKKLGRSWRLDEPTPIRVLAGTDGDDEL